MFQDLLDETLSPHGENDIHIALEITQQEATIGVSRIVSFLANMPCPLCHGRGVAQGVFLPSPCKYCQGKGIIACQKDFQVNVPPGIQSGHTVSCYGKGLFGLFAQSRGDLYIHIRVASRTPAQPPAPIHHQHPAAAVPTFHAHPTVADSHRAQQTSPGVIPPTQLGSYRIIRQLGSGGCGSVYLGQHVRLHTYAAIKVLQQITSQDGQAFLREAQTLAALKHPHILRVLDFGTEGVIPFLIMDYAEGGTIKELHPRGSQLSPHMVHSYLRQIAPALQYAHDHNVIHRDVKPDNMLLDDQNTILLSDFGIAVEAHHTGSMVVEEPYGTARYIAPEQLKGHPRPASDQYSLAVVVYEWLCGMLPFEGRTGELIRQHLYVSPVPLRQHISAIPSSVERVVLKALAKEPHQRFDSVRAFLLAFEYALRP